jgi:NAD(P)-dependent dehydrogenase (short-subunit alcohol dehydrogenase family)
MAPYCASKAGLNHLTNQVALDFGKHKIRCNSVLPGPVRTEMSEHSLGGMAKALGCDMDASLASSPALFLSLALRR